MTNLKKFFKDESGATAIEYGLLAALISIAAILVLPNVGTDVFNSFTAVDAAI